MGKKIIVEPPSKDERGFLRRTKTAFELADELQNDPNLETINKMVEFILPYIKEPANRKEAEEMLFDLSENQLKELFSAVSGKNSPTSAQPMNEQSSTGPKE